jgi:hypothetical protein
MADVIFDYPSWILRYPEFSAVTEPRADLFFSEATLYLRNDGTSPIQDVGKRAVILNMLTAHIAAMAGQATAGDGLVGRVSSASEGSTSVSTEYNIPGSAAWFVQTTYGAAAWQAMAPLRTARYIPRPSYGGRRWL